jgi:hypothetical protein
MERRLGDNGSDRWPGQLGLGAQRELDADVVVLQRGVSGLSPSVIESCYQLNLDAPTLPNGLGRVLSRTRSAACRRLRDDTRPANRCACARRLTRGLDQLFASPAAKTRAHGPWGRAAAAAVRRLAGPASRRPGVSPAWRIAGPVYFSPARCFSRRPGVSLAGPASCRPGVSSARRLAGPAKGHHDRAGGRGCRQQDASRTAATLTPGPPAASQACDRVVARRHAELSSHGLLPRIEPPAGSPPPDLPPCSYLTGAARGARRTAR